MTIADMNDMATQREEIRLRNFSKQGSRFSRGDKIAQKVTTGYKKVENTVTGSYKKVENAFTGGYKKVEDKFIDKFLRKSDETTAEARERLEHEQIERKAKQEAAAQARAEKIAAQVNSSVAQNPFHTSTAQVNPRATQKPQTNSHK